MEKEKKAEFKESIKEAQPKLVEVEGREEEAGESISEPNEVDQVIDQLTEIVDQASNQLKESQAGINLGYRYEILDHLGEGGTGQVYKVFDKELELTLAIKVLKKEVSEDVETRKRFLQEASLAMTLTHENIVSMYGPGETPDGTPFIVMDYLDGQSLEEILNDSKTLSEERFYSIFEQVLEGLSNAHSKGLVHRDLKPANIIVTTGDTGAEVVKIIDFGIVKLKETSLRTTHNLTQTGEIFGTPYYMSPEQCLGLEVDERSDIYALGCIMYEALTGKPPFDGENSVQIISKHLGSPSQSLNTDNQQLNDLVEDCLEKDSLHRPKNAISLLAKLRECKVAKTFPVSFKFKGIRKFISSDRSDILPGYRFLFGLYRLSQIIFLITIFPLLFMNPGEGQSIVGGYFALILYCLFYNANNISILKEASNTVLNAPGKPDNLVAFQRLNQFFFLKKSELRFEGEDRSEGYIENKKQIEVGPLPMECKRWFDEKGRAIAAKLGGHLHLKNLERVSLTPVQYGFFFLITSIKAQMLFGDNQSVCSFFTCAFLVALCYLLSLGIHGAIKTKSRSLGICSIVSVPLLGFSIMGILAQIIPGLVLIDYLRAVPPAWFLWSIFLPVIFWLTYGIFKGLTKMGIVQLSKRQ